MQPVRDAVHENLDVAAAVNSAQRIHRRRAAERCDAGHHLLCGLGALAGGNPIDVEPLFEEEALVVSDQTRPVRRRIPADKCESELGGLGLGQRQSRHSGHDQTEQRGAKDRRYGHLDSLV